MDGRNRQLDQPQEIPRPGSPSSKKQRRLSRSSNVDTSALSSTLAGVTEGARDILGQTERQEEEGGDPQTKGKAKADSLGPEDQSTADQSSAKDKPKVSDGKLNAQLRFWYQRYEQIKTEYQNQNEAIRSMLENVEDEELRQKLLKGPVHDFLISTFLSGIEISKKEDQSSQTKERKIEIIDGLTYALKAIQERLVPRGNAINSIPELEPDQLNRVLKEFASVDMPPEVNPDQLKHEWEDIEREMGKTGE